MAKLRASVRMLVAKAARLMVPILPSRLRIILLARLTAYEEALELQRKTDFWLRAASYTPVLAVDARGHRLLIDPTDQAISRELFFHGSFEVEGIDHIVALLNERGYAPQQVVDVGANIGTTTIELVARFPGACGFAFEPEPMNLSLLKHNLLGNGVWERVKVYGAAVSDREGEATLELSGDNPGDHRLRATEAPGTYQEERRETRSVPTVQLDDLSRRGEIDARRPGVLWIDAQGHEGHVLAGAQSLRGWPTVVEFWPYALKRSGGYELFLENVGLFAEVIELHRASRAADRVKHELTPQQIDALGAELIGRDPSHAYTDLVLWPHLSE